MAAAGTSLIWSPRSNITLYGDTARVSIARRLGVNIALGTDWMPTGSMNLLRELACADQWNRTYLDGFFRDEQLWEMVTANAAALTGSDAAIGTLAAGKVADIAIFDAAAERYHRAVIAARPAGVALVLRGGKALYGDASLVRAMPHAGTCEPIDVCGAAKALCAEDEIGKTYAELRAALGVPAYEAFYCGAPPDEPTCVPYRPLSVNGSTVYDGSATDGDADGDGIPDSRDDCPAVFDPVRPVDGGAQPDADGDGIGDACDPCPLPPRTESCNPRSLAPASALD
jgi:hypothetical protein